MVRFIEDPRVPAGLVVGGGGSLHPKISSSPKKVF